MKGGWYTVPLSDAYTHNFPNKKKEKKYWFDKFVYRYFIIWQYIYVYNVTKTWLCKTGYARLELDHCVYKVYKSFPPKICDMFCVVELTICLIWFSPHNYVFVLVFLCIAIRDLVFKTLHVNIFSHFVFNHLQKSQLYFIVILVFLCWCQEFFMIILKYKIILTYTLGQNWRKKKYHECIWA